MGKKLIYKIKKNTFQINLHNINKLSLNYVINLLGFLSISYFPVAFAQDGAVSNYITATSNLIAAIRTMSPTIFLLGLVFLLASVGAWIWFPKSRNVTGWVWASIGIIIMIYFVGTFYADPIKATFSAVLDPIKWISPSGI